MIAKYGGVESRWHSPASARVVSMASIVSRVRAVSILSHITLIQLAPLPCQKEAGPPAYVETKLAQTSASWLSRALRRPLPQRQVVLQAARASSSLGQSAVWAALAGRIGRAFHIVLRPSGSRAVRCALRRAPSAAAHPSVGRPACVRVGLGGWGWGWGWGGWAGAGAGAGAGVGVGIGVGVRVAVGVAVAVGVGGQSQG